MSHAQKNEKLWGQLRRLEERYGTESVRQMVLTSENTFPAQSRTPVKRNVVLSPTLSEPLTVADDEPPTATPPTLPDPEPAPAGIQRGWLSHVRRRYF